MDENIYDLIAEDRATADKRLQAIDDIGSGAARRLLEHFDRGEISDHTKMLEKVPAGLFEILSIPGLGPKTVKAMWKELSITSLAELEDALDSPELLELPRMGQKTIDNIRRAIDFSSRSRGRIPIGKALPIAEKITAVLSAIEGVERASWAGSLRRGRETIGDIDILAACRGEETIATVANCFLNLDGVEQVLAKGPGKCSVRFFESGTAVQVDLRIVPPEVWGAALMYFTGSKEHNVRLRALAIRQKRHLNEFGLFEGTEERPQDQGAKPLAAASEEEVYEVFGLTYIPPELREDRGELGEAGVPDDLIEGGDLIAELHSHTVASDGKLEIDALAEAAIAAGMKVLAITDHSVSSVLANGLDADRLRRHADAIREANERHAAIALLAGSEVDILPDGSLDYPDDLLAELDLVVASPHASLSQDRETATQRLLRALSNPHVDILGHPTGRIIGRRRGLEPDMDALVECAVRNDVALEINANPRRLDLRDAHVRLAVAAGCKISINTDAHSEVGFGYRPYGVLVARRAALRRDACINTWSAAELRKWLAGRGG